VNRHNLFRYALTLHSEGTVSHQLLMSRFADKLALDGKYDDAALAYVACQRLDEALECFKSCLRWQDALAMAEEMELGEDDMMDLANELSGRLLYLFRH
jgi:hypothetical protein